MELPRRQSSTQRHLVSHFPSTFDINVVADMSLVIRLRDAMREVRGDLRPPVPVRLGA